MNLHRRTRCSWRVALNFSQCLVCCLLKTSCCVTCIRAHKRIAQPENSRTLHCGFGCDDTLPRRQLCHRLQYQKYLHSVLISVQSCKCSADWQIEPSSSPLEQILDRKCSRREFLSLDKGDLMPVTCGREQRGCFVFL